MTSRKVTAVLTTFNSESDAKQCIDSLLNQTTRFDEIVVVDDGSKDGTVDVLKKYGSKIRLSGLKKNIGRSAARNYGWKKAKNGIVFFAESDAVYDSNFVKYSMPHFDDEKIAGVIGKQEVLNKNESVWTKCKNAERETAFENYKPFSVWFHRKKLLEKADGFDESLDFGEDVDLSKRIKNFGHKLDYEEKAIWKHREPASLKAVIKRSWSFGKGINKYYKKTGFPKTVFLDFVVLLTIFGSFFYFPLILVFTGYLLAKLLVSIKLFGKISPVYWIYLIIFILVPSFTFKMGRIIGFIKG